MVVIKDLGGSGTSVRWLIRYSASLWERVALALDNRWKVLVPHTQVWSYSLTRLTRETTTQRTSAGTMIIMRLRLLSRKTVRRWLDCEIKSERRGHAPRKNPARKEEAREVRIVVAPYSTFTWIKRFDRHKIRRENLCAEELSVYHWANIEQWSGMYVAPHCSLQVLCELECSNIVYWAHRAVTRFN